MASLSPTKVAKVHGYVQALSPMKQSSAGTSKYFTCEVTDGQSHRRAVGFDSKVRQKLAGFYERKMPVAIGNCQIKESPYSSSLEVVIRNSSDLHQSPLEFPMDVNTLSTDSTVTINLEELPQLSNFQKVSVTKVTDVHDVVKVKDLTKQEYSIADATSTSTIVVWEDSVGILSEGCSYKLSGLLVRTFGNEKFLSVPRDNFTITEIDDIGEVSVPAVANASNEHVTQAVVKGIKHLDVFRACYSCTGKVAETSEVLRDCTRCGVTQKIETCKLRFRGRVDLQSEGNLITVTAFTPILENICQTDDVTKAALLTSTPFNATINNNIVTSISH